VAKLKRAQGIALVCVLVLGLSACSSSSDSGAELSGELNLFLIPSPSSTSIQSFIPEFEATTGVKVNVSETPYGEAHQKQLLSYKQKAGAYDIAQFDNSFLAPFCQAQAMTALDEWISGSDLYEKLGLKPATTWDEWYSNAKAVADSGASGQLIGFGPNVSWWWMTMVWSFGGKLYDENLNPTVNSPEAIAAVDYMKKLLSVSPKGAITANGDEVTSKFLGENIGAMLNYSGYYGMALDPSINKNAGKFATAPMPKGASDITHLAGWNIGIPADAKNPDAAWAFLEFVLGKSNAKAYLESGAAAIGRKSIISDSSLLEKNPYLPQLEIPASSRIERYPQIAVWPEFEVAAIDAVTKVLTGKSATKAAMDALNEKLKSILANEPR
jgi:multiple sugar transport system substrate-binding protein